MCFDGFQMSQMFRMYISIIFSFFRLPLKSFNDFVIITKTVTENIGNCLFSKLCETSSSFESNFSFESELAHFWDGLKRYYMWNSSAV